MIILTDCDGVLLNWVNGFDEWMLKKGYTKHTSSEYDVQHTYQISAEEADRLVLQFSESAAIGFLETWGDSFLYLNKFRLLCHGEIHVISSFSDDIYSDHLRRRNLNVHFGDIFYRYIFLPCGADKTKELLHYKKIQDNTAERIIWIEDKPENACIGAKMGFETFLIRQPYNAAWITNYTDNHHPIPNLKIVDGWADIYKNFLPPHA